MRKFILAGVLALVFASCASTPRGEPSPFEGQWFVSRIEEPGALAQFGIYPYSMLFQRNEFSLMNGREAPDGTLAPSAALILGRRFTYTDTEITVAAAGRNDAPKVFKYVLTVGSLTTTDDDYGTVIWIRQ